MSVVITGATGHLGRLIVEDLLAAGFPADQTVATGRKTEAMTGLAARGVRTVAADFERPETLTAAFEGADTVMFVSGNEAGRRVAQHTNVIEAAKAAGVRRIVYTSACQADTTRLFVAPEHKATEKLIRESGLAFTILRNGWYTENYLSAAQQASATGMVIAGAGDGRVASASRADYAAAASVVLRADGHDGAVYELSGDTAWTHDELAAAIAEIAGRPVTYRSVTEEELRPIVTGAGLDDSTVEFLLSIDRDTRDGLLAATSGDLSRLIGRPTTPLVDGLRAALADG